MKMFSVANEHGETNITRQQLGQIATQIGVANTRLATLLVAMDKINKHLGLDRKAKLDVTEVETRLKPWLVVSKNHEARIKNIHDKLGTGFVTHEMMMHATGENRKTISAMLYAAEHDPKWTRVQQSIGSNKFMYKVFKNA